MSVVIEGAGGTGGILITAGPVKGKTGSTGGNRRRTGIETCLSTVDNPGLIAPLCGYGQTFGGIRWCGRSVTGRTRDKLGKVGAGSSTSCVGFLVTSVDTDGGVDRAVIGIAINIITGARTSRIRLTIIIITAIRVITGNDLIDFRTATVTGPVKDFGFHRQGITGASLHQIGSGTTPAVPVRSITATVS